MQLSLYLDEFSGINNLRNRLEIGGVVTVVIEVGTKRGKDIERKGLFEWLSRIAYKGFLCPWFGGNIAIRSRYN